MLVEAQGLFKLALLRGNLKELPQMVPIDFVVAFVA